MYKQRGETHLLPLDDSRPHLNEVLWMTGLIAFVIYHQTLPVLFELTGFKLKTTSVTNRVPLSRKELRHQILH